MRSLILPCLALAALALPALAQGDASWKEQEKAFEEDWKKKSIRFKQRALDNLPVKDVRTIELIVEKEKLLSDKDWWVRVAAAEKLGQIRVADLRKKLHSYATSSKKEIREGAIAALAMSQDRLDAPVIIEALKDKTWEVRRMACWAAGQQRLKEAVEPMINMLHDVHPVSGDVLHEGEQHPRVASVLLFNLEEITGQTTLGTSHKDWLLWWEQNKERTFPPTKRFGVGTFGDVKLSYNDTYARRGTGPLVIALPQVNQTCLYYMPYFSQWLFVQWLFINMPPIESFPDIQRAPDGDPIYPVDILVDAFEDMRKQRRAEKMVLLGQGFTCWVAAKYAQKYPDRVEGLILLNPYASNETFRKRIDEALRSGDPDAEYWGKVSSKQLRTTNRYEWEVYDYYNCTGALGPKTRDDMEIGILRRLWKDPGGSSVTIPQFDIRGEDTSSTPCLMFFAKKGNELTGIDDLNRLRRYYPKHLAVDGRNDSARLMFMQDPERFEKALRTFIDKKID